MRPDGQTGSLARPSGYVRDCLALPPISMSALTRPEKGHWYALSAQATLGDVIADLNSAVVHALADPAVRQMLAE